jgi:hypothetical protein
MEVIVPYKYFHVNYLWTLPKIPAKDKRDKADLKNKLQPLFGIYKDPFPYSKVIKGYKSEIKMILQLR